LNTAKTQYRKFVTNVSRTGIARSQSQFPHSQTHECGNWARGRDPIPFLGIHKWTFPCNEHNILPKVTGSCLAAEAVGPDTGSAVDRDDADGGGVGGGGGGGGGCCGQPVEEVLGLPARARLQS
jgi:hypothetical protein